MLNSRSTGDLALNFRMLAEATLAGCRERGLDIIVASTLRDLEAQACLYRMNRPRGEIEAKAAKFNARGFGFLADVLMRVGPQPDDDQGIRTNAGPGESWHNYGVAMDCYPLVHGKLAKDTDTALWRVYGEEARKRGLEWAGGWTSFREFPHVQLAPGSNPLKQYPPEKIKVMLGAWL